MTNAELQDLVIAGLQDKIMDSFTIRERITNSFAAWFQALAVPSSAPPPPEEEGEPSEG
jgi:hypothetical protein